MRLILGLNMVEVPASDFFLLENGRGWDDEWLGRRNDTSAILGDNIVVKSVRTFQTWKHIFINVHSQSETCRHL